MQDDKKKEAEKMKQYLIQVEPSRIITASPIGQLENIVEDTIEDAMSNENCPFKGPELKAYGFNPCEGDRITYSACPVYQEIMKRKEAKGEYR